MHKDIFFYRDTIEGWINASVSREQLNVCEQAIDTFIINRFSRVEKPMILAEVLSYLAVKVADHHKFLPVMVAGSIGSFETQP